MPTPSFSGLRVLVLESRRARELGLIVTSYRGEPLLAPSMREVPIESNAEAVKFIDDLIAGEFDVVVLLTGVGARVLLDIVQRVQGTRKRLIDALKEAVVVCRGPKPLAVMREIGLPVFLTAPEPNTWRELLVALDARRSELSLAGLNVAVQEYGASNLDLLKGLEERGARVTPVPVYQWALPEDVEPLRKAARAVAAGEIRLFAVMRDVKANGLVVRSCAQRQHEADELQQDERADTAVDDCRHDCDRLNT